MQFVYPNLLYLLFLLCIPILIHLFQLRRFTPVAFTNVAMLQRLKKQSRKSQSLLEWLLLLLRLLVYTFIILAFAQPYFLKDSTNPTQEEYLYYIDNYLSWDAKNESKSLLQEFKEEIETLNTTNQNINWFTNTDVYYNQSTKQFIESIQSLELSPIVKTSKEVLLQAEQLASLNPKTKYTLIWVSDFHRFNEKDLESTIPIKAYAVQSPSTQNTSIDTLYINSSNSKLTSILQHTGKDSETTVTLYSNEAILGRQKVALKNNSTQEVSFNINHDLIPQGRIQIEDSNIQIDNIKYFSLNHSNPIKVHAIGNGENNFLKVFKSEEFQLTQQDAKSKDFSDIEGVDLLLLYNVEDISMQLANLIENSVAGGNSLIIIPSETINLKSYNDLFIRLGIPEFTNKKNHPRRLSSIHYEHPLFQGVFERKVDNFKAPYVNQYFGLKSEANTILSYDSGESFLTQKGRVFLFTASLNEQNTNIIKSPIIVPIFFKIGIQSKPDKGLYQSIGYPTTYSITGVFNEQDLLTLTDDNESFIPIQEHKKNGVWITTSTTPRLSGNYKILNKEEVIDWVSYNYPNLPKNIHYPDLSKWHTIDLATSFPLANTDESLQQDSSLLWKWFVIFALLFLGIEIILLKLYR